MSSPWGGSRFDLGVFPPGTVAGRATLRLFVETVGNPGLVDLQVVLEAWGERTLTAATEPARAPALASVAFSSANAGSYYSIDLTPEVNAWLDGTSPNHGLVSPALSPARSPGRRGRRWCRTPSRPAPPMPSSGGTLPGTSRRRPSRPT